MRDAPGGRGPGLPSADGPLSPARRREWYAVHTRSRHEKKADLRLSEKSIETFLPLRETLSAWKDRKKKIRVPLFPGYLFVRIDPRENLDVLNTRGVVRILGRRGVPVPVPEREIDAARRLVTAGLPYGPFPYNAEGREAVILKGPLEGVRGRVTSVRGAFRLILSVHLIKSAVAVEVDAGDVELV